MKKLNLFLFLASSVLFSQAIENPITLETAFNSYDDDSTDWNSTNSFKDVPGHSYSVSYNDFNDKYCFI